MADDNRYNDDDRTPRKGGEFRVPPRTWIVWIVIFSGIIALMLLRERMDSPGQVLTQWDFLQKVESNHIASAIINYNPQDPFLTEIAGKYYRTDAAGNIIKTDTVAFRTKARLTQKLEDKLLA